MATFRDVQEDLENLKDDEKAAILSRFFKTGKGEYGEGDVFLGITVPKSRNVASKYKDISLNDVRKLLSSRFHEHRFAALEILAFKYEKSDDADKKAIADFYLCNTARINNWDLVDTSAPYILGDYLLHNDRKILYSLAKSRNLWERRIAIVSTFAFIRGRQFDDALKIAKVLMNDGHDLIHKAVGWMLREIGKKDLKVLESFLERHSSNMPRTMLRYSIERLSEAKRRYYLNR